MEKIVKKVKSKIRGQNPESLAAVERERERERESLSRNNTKLKDVIIYLNSGKKKGEIKIRGEPPD